MPVLKNKIQIIISSCLLVFAEFLRVSELLSNKRSDIIFESYYVSIFIPKVKLTYIATEIQLSYPEWIATCIQLINLEKYLLLLNRNLTKCKDRFEFRKEIRPLSYTRMRELFIIRSNGFLFLYRCN
jgi:integrase